MRWTWTANRRRQLDRWLDKDTHYSPDWAAEDIPALFVPVALAGETAESLSDVLEVVVDLGDQVAALVAQNAAQAALIEHLRNGRDHLVDVRDNLCDQVARLTDALEAAEVAPAPSSCEPVTITITVTGGQVAVPVSTVHTDRRPSAPCATLPTMHGQTTEPMSARDRLAALRAKVEEAKANASPASEVAVTDREIVISIDASRGNWDVRLDAVRKLNVRTWDGQAKVWRTPFTQAPQVLALINRSFLVVDQTTREALDMVLTTLAGIAAESSAGSAEDYDLNFDLPDEYNLFPYQVAGVRYACRTGRCIIGDEMGLGKTLQALAAIAQKGIKRAVVSVPAIVHTNWQHEAHRFFPGMVVLGVGGRKPEAIPDDVNIVVVGQDVLTNWAETLIAWQPQALVCDESQNYKTQGSQRTQAAQAIAEVIPQDGLVLLLTGTVIENRPAELIAQLRIIGRLREIAGTATNFLHRYSDGTPQGLGTATQHRDLLDALRTTCYLRRNQADVMPELPDIFRSEMTVEDNPVALAVYRQMERDIKGYLRANLDPDEAAVRIAAHARAEAITRITMLRKQAALVKLPAVANWAAAYAEERPLVIFAHHREVVDGLVAVLGCPKIDGGIPAAKRAEICEEFQAGKHQVVVVATRAGGTGINLFRASTVLFVEADWSPGRWQQAEFRVKRIGQTADKCLSIFARTTAETVDGYMASVVIRKWGAVEGINAGREEAMFDGEVEDDSIADSVIEWLVDR